MSNDVMDTTSIILKTSPTLIMLVSAFAGRELILHAYEEAIKEKYRFFSYGDCMMIV